MMAFFLLVVSTIALYLAWRLFMGRIKAFPDLQLVTTVMATLAFSYDRLWELDLHSLPGEDAGLATLLLPGARARGPQSIFRIQGVYSAFHTAAVGRGGLLFSGATAGSTFERNWTRTSVAILIALHFFYFVLAFGLARAVTKLKSI